MSFSVKLLGNLNLIPIWILCRSVNDQEIPRTLWEQSLMREYFPYSMLKYVLNLY